MFKNNKGFTIVEVVVAMTVITIISVVSIETINRGRSLTSQTNSYAEARSIVDNALECFKYSLDLDQYKSVLYQVGHDVTTVSDTVDSVTTYTYVGTYYTLTINVTFYDSESDSSSLRDSFHAVAYKTNTKSGQRLFEITYNKGQ